MGLRRGRPAVRIPRSEFFFRKEINFAKNRSDGCARLAKQSKNQCRSDLKWEDQYSKIINIPVAPKSSGWLIYTCRRSSDLGGLQEGYEERGEVGLFNNHCKNPIYIYIYIYIYCL